MCLEISLLAEIDEARSQTSKKDEQLRTAEIRQAASGPLLAWLAKDGPEVVRDPGGSLVVTEVMLGAEGGEYSVSAGVKHRNAWLSTTSADKATVSEALLNLLTSPYPSADSTNPHVITLPHTSRVYKLLLQGGHFSHGFGEVERSSHFSPLDFAKQFVSVVGKDNTLAIARDDGAFVVAALCERALEDEELKQTLKSWFSRAFVTELEQEQDRRGRTVLLKQIAALS